MIQRTLCLMIGFISLCILDVDAQEPVLMEGWPVLIHDSGLLGAPLQGLTLYDIDGDGYLDIFMSLANKIHCYDYQGNPLPGWPYISANPGDGFANSPLIGDIDGDGEPEIVDDWENPSRRESKLIALNPDGTMCDGFPADMAANNSFWQLALYDLDGDGAMEIIAGVFQIYPDTLMQLRVFRGNGEMFPGWPAEGIYAVGLAVGDIDNDGSPEIVATGGDSWDHDLFAFEQNGGNVDGFPVNVGTEGWTSCWSTGTPALFDLEGDGFLEILAGYRQIYTPDSSDYFLTMYNYRGEAVPLWPFGLKYFDEIHVGPSISRAGVREDYYAAIGTIFGGNYYLVTMDAEKAPGWPFNHGDYAAGSWDQPTIGDIDGDGSVDYLFNYNLEVRDSITGLWMGRIWALNQSGELLDYFPLWVLGTTFPGGVSLADIDNDGIVEMAFQADYFSSGQPTMRIYVFKLTGIAYEPERFPWPMSCHDPQHTNNLTYRPPSGVPYDEDTGLPKRAFLDNNYPNPFNSSTTIRFGIPTSGQVSVRVYNLLGQAAATIIDEDMPAGDHSVLFDAEGLSSGIYFYKLNFGEKSITRRMMLLK